LYFRNKYRTTATATKPVSLSSVSTAGVKNVQFSDQVRVFDINKSNVVTEPVREERKIPPPPLINMGRPKRLSSTVKITGEGRQILTHSFGPKILSPFLSNIIVG
jgi:hypothetical protein